MQFYYSMNKKKLRKKSSRGKRLEFFVDFDFFPDPTIDNCQRVICLGNIYPGDICPTSLKTKMTEMI